MSTPSNRERGPAGPIAVAIAALIACVAAPTIAWSQACCTATGAGEFAVVGRCHSAVIATELSLQRGLGTFTDRGEYRGLNHAEVDDVVLSLGGGFRPFGPNWQVYGSVPTRLQYRAFDGLDSELHAGLGDAAAGVRWTALHDGMQGIQLDEPGTLVPFVDLYATVKAPTGRAPEDTSSLIGADITGDGAWQLGAGVKLSKFLTPRHVLGVTASYGHSLERTVDKGGGDTTRYAPGDELDLKVTYLNIHDLFWSWGLSAGVNTTGKAYADGEAVAHSHTRRLQFGAHLTHGFSFPYWEASVAVVADAWWDDASTNLPFVGPAVTLTLRRQFM
jgi:hypothetical protein